MRTLLNSEPSLVLPVPRGELVGQRAMHGRVASEQMDVVLVARSGTQLIEVPNASFSDLYRMMFLGDTLLERRQRKPRQSVRARRRRPLVYGRALGSSVRGSSFFKGVCIEAWIYLW